jgi:hypothetical protein
MRFRATRNGIFVFSATKGWRAIKAGCQARELSDAPPDGTRAGRWKPLGKRVYPAQVRERLKSATTNGKIGSQIQGRQSCLPGIELPGQMEDFSLYLGNRFGWAPSTPVGVVLCVEGGTIGQGAVVKTDLWPTPVNPTLQLALCHEQSQLTEAALHAIAQPLRDEADKRLTRVGESAKDLQRRIHKEEERLPEFYGNDVFRNPQAEAKSKARIAALKSQLTPLVFAQNRSPGALYQAVQASGGHGLLAYYTDGAINRLLDSKKGAQDLLLLAQTGEGRTPDQSYTELGKGDPVVRPAVGCLLSGCERTLGRIVCSTDHAVAGLAEHLTLIRAPLLSCRLFSADDCYDSLGFWAASVARWVTWRDSGPRQFVLCPAARTVLLDYIKEVERRGSGQRWLKNSVLIVIKIGLNLHVWRADVGEQIGETTMRTAVALARWFSRETATTAVACLAAEQERQLRVAAEIMLRKLKNFGRAVRPRQLYQRYHDERVSIHRPVLEHLINRGQVRALKDGCVESVEI